MGFSFGNLKTIIQCSWQINFLLSLWLAFDYLSMVFNVFQRKSPRHSSNVLFVTLYLTSLVLAHWTLAYVWVLGNCLFSGQKRKKRFYTFSFGAWVDLGRDIFKAGGNLFLIWGWVEFSLYTLGKEQYTVKMHFLTSICIGPTWPKS